MESIEQRWTVARSVPQHPHMYVARAWLSDDQQADFDAVVGWVYATGYTNRFWGSNWRTADLDGWAIWPSRSWYGPDAGKPDAMLNRRSLAVGQMRMEIASRAAELARCSAEAVQAPTGTATTVSASSATIAERAGPARHLRRWRRQGDDPDSAGLPRMLAEVDQFDVLIIRDLDRFCRSLLLYVYRPRGAEVRPGSRSTSSRATGSGSSCWRPRRRGRPGCRPYQDACRPVREGEDKAPGPPDQGRTRRGGLHPGGKRSFGYERADTGQRKASTQADLRSCARVPVETRSWCACSSWPSRYQPAQDHPDPQRRGHPSATGGRWAQSAVPVLANPLYIGKISRRGANGEWELHEGKHEPILRRGPVASGEPSRATPERRTGGRPLAPGTS